ncbi:signal recognition particle-docking protein FtsY [Bosea lathyri]|uniref:Signal recognition particle receptor FtsY n=1 Tax=Bosea lathyri TaxID=1036778 RepID=A0A1H6DD93_9HYPH|nr:signal recognition particle-docking protein FtsY [Bosea lathyri]SEG82436.1 fused signal recognition particle receptor [Bosea lathyri]
MSETEPKKRGFFSRLFGLEGEQAKQAEQEAAPGAVEAVPEAGPQPEPDGPIAPEVLLGEAAPLPIAMPEPAPLPAPPVMEPPVVAAPPVPKRSWWRRLTEGLSRTSSALTTGITDLFTKRKLDSGTLEDLEDILIQADLGLATAARIAKAVGDGRYDKQIEPDEVRAILAREVEEILTPVALPLSIDATKKPFVILMVGVNGSGKTTTIGKLAAKFRAEGKSVMLAAGDTFRAAAIEQLKVWGERTGAEVVSGQQGADASGLAFEALQKAKAAGTDVLLVDTAGRLQNKTGLMDELAKVVRVIRKLDPDSPHAALLVLDATVGQNAISQVEAFQQIAGVTGLVMTKLDGTARGGILVALAAKFGLPVHFIGVGESVEDLEPFSARDFARAVAGLGEVA